VNLFSFVLLIESDNSQDGGQDHSGAMDPSHSFVKPDRTASFGSRHPGRTDTIVSGNEIQVPRQPSKSGMQIARRGAGALAAGLSEVATVTIKGMVVIKPIR
jgi:hypothetical protein